jgi:hypothetical protein
MKGLVATALTTQPVSWLLRTLYQFLFAPAAQRIVRLLTKSTYHLLTTQPTYHYVGPIVVMVLCALLMAFIAGKCPTTTSKSQPSKTKLVMSATALIWKLGVQFKPQSTRFFLPLHLRFNSLLRSFWQINKHTIVVNEILTKALETFHYLFNTA